MLRLIVAVVVGYFVMTIVVSAVHFIPMVSGNWMYEPGLTVELTPTWFVYALVGGFVAAVVGGFVAALIAGSAKQRAVFALAAVIVILGLLYAIAQSGAPEVQVPPNVPRSAFEERMAIASQIREPLWYLVTLPFLGAAGAIAGGWLRKTRK